MWQAIVGGIFQGIEMLAQREGQEMSAEANKRMLDLAKIVSDLRMDKYERTIPLRDQAESAFQKMFEEPDKYMTALASQQIEPGNEEYTKAVNALNEEMALRGMVGSGTHAERMGGLEGARAATVGKAKSEASRFPYEAMLAFYQLGQNLPATSLGGLATAAEATAKIGNQGILDTQKQGELWSDLGGFASGLIELNRNADDVWT